jgi:hypothetical protein
MVHRGKIIAVLYLSLARRDSFCLGAQLKNWSVRDENNEKY